MDRLRTWWMTRRFLRNEYPRLPSGWVSRFQAATLYQCGLNHAGPILEIGAWVGRSTCCIAAGIRDSGTTKQFVTTDLGLSSSEEWKEFFGSPVTKKPQKDLYLGVIEQEGGTMAVLTQNLAERNLQSFVTVRKGDFRSMDLGQFGLIFCDVTHNVREIQANAPRIRDLLAPGGTLVADDIRSPELLEALLGCVPCERYTLREALFVGKKAA